MKKRKSDEEIRQELEFGRNKVLSRRSINSYYTHDKWVDAITAAEDYYIIMSLLHFGLDETMHAGNKYDFSDVVSLYFDYAYGYDNLLFSFSNPEARSSGYEEHVLDKDERLRSTTEDGCKRLIAEKAFAVVCQKFLKDKREGNSFKNAHNRPSWWNMLMYEDSIIFPKIIEFFSFEKNIPRKIGSHTNEIAIDFLYKLATSAWKVNFPAERERTIPKKLIEQRAFFIKILWEIGETDFLVKHWELLSREDLETITTLATSLDDYTGPISLEAALLDGKEIAEAYVLIKKKVELSETTLRSQIEIIEAQESEF